MNQQITLNSEKIFFEDLLFFDCLDENSFLEKAFENEIIKQESRRKNIMNTRSELFNYLNKFKIRKGLDSVEKYNFWLRTRHLTEERLIHQVDSYLLKQKLYDSISDKTLKEYYDENVSSFDKVCIHSFTIPDKEFARFILNQLQSGEIDFQFPVIKRTGERNNMKIDEFIGWIKRNDNSSTEEEIIFDKNTDYNEIIGPYKSKRGYKLTRILSKDYSDFEKDKNLIHESYFSEYIYRLKMTTEIKVENI